MPPVGLHAVVRVADLNEMTLKVGAICRHRRTPEQLVHAPNATSLNFRSRHNNAALQIKTSENAGLTTQAVWAVVFSRKTLHGLIY